MQLDTAIFIIFSSRGRRGGDGVVRFSRGFLAWREVGDGVGGEDGLYLALPDGEDGVTEGAEVGEVAGVALFVGGEFGLPEVAARGG